MTLATGKRWRLLLLTYYFPPCAAAATYRALGIVKHLPAFGWDVEVIAPPIMPFEPDDWDLLQNVLPSTRVTRVPFPNSTLWSLLTKRNARYECWLEPASQAMRRVIAARRHDAYRETRLFFDSVHKVRKPGGVFWGFTIDARTPYAKLSRAMLMLAVRDRYLDLMFAGREKRHKNYPTYYAANTPAQIALVARQFARVETISLHHIGILDGVLPKFMRPLSHLLDRATLRYGWPGTNLAVRLVK